MSVPFFSNPTAVRISASVASVLFILTMVLQLLLAVGVLPISMAWGGRQSELTPGLRMASVAAAVLLGLFLYVIRRRAGLIGDLPSPLGIKVLAWVITVYMALNTLGNLTSPSTGEKLLFGPISLLLALSSLFVSASRLEN